MTKVYGLGIKGLLCGALAIIWGGCAAPDVFHKEPALADWSEVEESGTSTEAGSPAPESPAAEKAEAPLAAGRKASAAREEHSLTVASLPPPLAVRPLELAPVMTAEPPPSLPTDIVSELDLADEADVGTVLRTLAKAANVNMLVSPEVKGQIRFTFKNVPWDQAFRSVISSAGLTYAWEGNVLRVMTMDDVKRLLEMEKLLKEREGVKAEKQRIEPLTVHVIPVKYSKAATVGATVKSLLAAAPAVATEGVLPTRTTISIDEENNAIVVHAIADEVKKAVALVQQLDRPKAQVHIEARIVEASRDTARQLGVQWGGKTARLGDGRMITVGGSGATAAGFNSDFAALFAQKTDPTALPSAPVGFTFGLISEKISAVEVLNAQLTALQKKGRIQILASPSITTLDNESAIIESGEERAYQKSSGTGTGVDIEWKKAVLKLEVTPHVVDENYLRVEIIANKDSFDETKPESSGELPVNTKHARTTVLLRNGDTVVIGGLSLQSDSDTQTGIPWLMDIPLLGNLFRNRGRASQFSETLIFITPEIIAAVQ